MSARPLLDLTESDPARCGLGWDSTDLEAILRDGREAGPDRLRHAGAQARDAVASYLAGRGISLAPDRIRLTRSRGDAIRLAVQALCDASDEILVASPGDPVVERLAATGPVRVGRYALAYDREWHLDRKSLAGAVTDRTRAVLAGNPSEPMGAMLSREDLAFLEVLCTARGMALVVDEAFIDTGPGASPSALEATRCLAFHVSGLSGVCGLPGVGAEWLAAAGPDDLVAAALARLDEALRAGPASVPAPVEVAIPALLARRERFLAPLRARLAGNRTSLATAALREAPWSLCWGGGGCWAVLRIGSAEGDEALCRALRGDGVAVQPGSAYGLPDDGYLVVSLLPPPDVFVPALSRIDRRLRAPILG